MRKIQSLLILMLLSAAAGLGAAYAASTGYAYCYFATTAMRSMGSIGVSTTSNVAVGAANSSCTSCHYDGSFTAYFRAEVKDSRYRFKGWSTRADYFWSQSTELTFSKFVGSGNSVTLYAWFEEVPTEVTVSVAVADNCGGMGVIGGGGSFSAGTSVTVTATPDDGYLFKGWSTTSDGSSIVSTAQNYTFSAYAVTLYAVFGSSAPEHQGTILATGNGTAENWSTAVVPDGFVDLGLPSGTLWAKKNVGGDGEYSVGLYFAWGSLTGRTSTYAKEFTEANYPSSAASKNESWTGDAAYDPATAANPATHTPTKAEWDELLAYTTQSYGKNVKFYGSTGYLFEGNGEYIYLTTETGIADGMPNVMASTYAHYWSSTLFSGTGTDKKLYYYLGGANYNSVVFTGTSAEPTEGKCWHGMSIRPVCPGSGRAVTLTIVAKTDKGGTSQNTYRCDKGGTVRITAQGDDAYTFLSWEDNGSTDAVRDFTVTEDMTCTALFKATEPETPEEPEEPEEPETPQSYDITYLDIFGTEFTGTLAEGSPVQHTCGTATTLLQPEKAGSEFGGWYMEDDCFGVPVTEIAADNCAAVTLYAKWSVPIQPEDPEEPEEPETPQSYDITYLDIFGTAFTGTLAEGSPVQHTCGTSTALLQPEKEGSEFGGWYMEDDCFGLPVTEIAADNCAAVTLYAKWSVPIQPEDPEEPEEPETPQSYDITYLDIFGTAFSGILAEGSPVQHTCGTATALLQPEKEGSEFGGWYMEDDCFGVPVTEIAADNCAAVTLYAKWSVPIQPEDPEEPEIKQTVVTLDFNNGTGESQTVLATNGEAMPSQTNGGQQLLVPMMVGYEFGGYYDTNAGTGGTQYYAANMAGTRTWDREAETFTLYARWTRPETPDTPEQPEQPEDPDNGPIVLEDNHQAGDAYYDMLASRVGRTVESVTYKRSFAARTWSVFSVPFDYSFLQEGNTTFKGDVYELSSADYVEAEQCLTFYFLPVTTEIKANRPYIYYSETGVKNPVFESVTISAVADNSYMAEGNMVEFRNSTVYQTISPDPKVVLLNNNRLYYMLGSTTYMRAFRGYFYLQRELSAPRARIVVGGRTATEIEVVRTEDQPSQQMRKYVEGGRLVIEREGVRYDATGSRID